MDVYIKREPIVNRLTNYMRDCEEANDTLAAQVFQDCIGEIMDQKQEDVAPVIRAEWVQVIYHVEFEDGFVDRVYECCSACHMPNGRKQTIFCPNCGARMV